MNSQIKHRCRNWRTKIRHDLQNREKSEISELVLQEDENLSVDEAENQWVHTVNEHYALMTLKDFFIPEFEKTFLVKKESDKRFVHFTFNFA